jgi:uncharacterized repeat protein (TIGR03837 family)
MDFNSIDIFCHCIDNFGDAGVAYRFAKELKAARPGCRVRVFVDDMTVLQAIVDNICADQTIQEFESITYINTSSLDKLMMDTLGVADVMVEIFACHIPEYLLELAYDNSRLIINLEYLSAEDWVEGYHLKESLLGRGSVRKFFFMPGFRETTGGLIINSQLYSMISEGKIDKCTVLNNILNKYNITITPDDNRLFGTVFTYQRGFDTLLSDLAELGRETVLMVFGEKSQVGMMSTLKRFGVNGVYGDGQQSIHKPINSLDADSCNIHNPAIRYKNILIIPTPFIGQHAYDALLCCTDFNIVRGEDSLARAVLSGKPFIWNAYIQDQKYQRVKVEALLKMMQRFYEDMYDNVYKNTHNNVYDNVYSDVYDRIFADYETLLLAFNDAAEESSDQTTSERYDIFFKNLKKHEQAARAMNYFMHRNCNLIKNFFNFLDGYDILG